MTLVARPYRDPSDIDRMRDLLVEGTRSGIAASYVHPGVLDLAMHFPRDEPARARDFRLWEDAADAPARLLAWAMHMPGEGAFDLFVHPSIHGTEPRRGHGRVPGLGRDTGSRGGPDRALPVVGDGGRHGPARAAPGARLRPHPARSPAGAVRAGAGRRCPPSGSRTGSPSRASGRPTTPPSGRGSRTPRSGSGWAGRTTSSGTRASSRRMSTTANGTSWCGRRTGAARPPARSGSIR